MNAFARASGSTTSQLHNFTPVSSRTHLDEANVGRLLTEALAADVEAILADQTMGVAAHTAAQHCERDKRFSDLTGRSLATDIAQAK